MKTRDTVFSKKSLGHEYNDKITFSIELNHKLHALSLKFSLAYYI
jgi:hypothetical protein